MRVRTCRRSDEKLAAANENQNDICVIRNSRCIFHLFIFPFSFFFWFRMKWTLTRDRAAQLRYLSKRFLSTFVRIASIDLYFSSNLSLFRLLLCQPQTGRESGETEADSLESKNRDVSCPMIARSLART